MASIISSVFKATSLANSVKGLVQDRSMSKIGDLFIDAVVDEVITLESSITEHPLEDKTAITDHIYRKPKKVSMTGYITDSPIRFMGLFETPLQKNSLSKFMETAKGFLPFVDSKTPSQQAYQILKNIRDNKQIITVVTELETFRSMAIESLIFPRTPGNQGRLEFKIELKEIVYSKVMTTVNTNNKVGRIVQKKIKVGIEPKPETQPTENVGLIENAVKAGKDWLDQKFPWFTPKKGLEILGEGLNMSR